MSLALVRDHVLATKKAEVAECQQALGRKLTTLYRLTNLVGSTAIPTNFDLHAPPTPEELHFLEINDIARGGRFQEDTLPHIELQDAAQTTTQAQSLSVPSTSQAREPLSPLLDGPDKRAAKEYPRKSVERLGHEDALHPHTPPRSPSSFHSAPPDLSDQDAARSHGHEGTAAVAEGESQEIASVTGNDKSLQPLNASLAPQPAKEESGPAHKDFKEAQALLPSVAIDAISSPSSTAGACSASTPKPPQHSPDTSPDEGASSPHELHGPVDTERSSRTVGQKDGGVSRREDTRQNEERNETSAHKLIAPQPDASEGKSSEKAAESPAQVNLLGTRPGILRNSSSKPERSGLSIVTGAGNSNRAASIRDVDMQDAAQTSERTELAGSDIVTPATARTSGQGPAHQRMTTRVASGAIRQRSVTELLGGTPRAANLEHASISSQPFGLTSKALVRSVPGTPVEDRSKMSMVVFSKRDKDRSPKALDSEEDGYLALRGAADDLEKDYMRPLFLQQAYQPPRAHPLSDLIGTANKTISTSNVRATLKERTDHNVLRRIYTMQNANKWSLRQMKRYPDPPQPPCHWDHLMAEMKWMRTDFREERKWKMAVAQNLAYWCSMYVAASEEDKQHLRVRVRHPRVVDPQDRMDVDDAASTPALVHSGTTESDHSSVEELPRMPTIAPTALFGLGYDDYAFELDPTPAADGVLGELPLYQPKIEPLQARDDPFVPASKFATAKIIPKPEAPPHKRSRFEYEEEEYESTLLPPAKRRASEVSLFLSPSRRSPRIKELPPEESDVALFSPINRHMRQRLRDNVAFRPPSEFLMPQTSFFEHRVPSQWTWDEDQRLRSCVRNYSYNWSLISMEMQQFTQPSMFVAGTERRTPWECFERWVQLEGLPADMGKTQYFRTYQNRLEMANKSFAEKRPQQQQQVQTPGQPAQTRVRGTQPFRVERRREGRYVTMIDAIRKIARKRENLLHRQQETAKAAVLRKQQQQENQQARQTTIHTPAEFSRMKHERDLKNLEKQEQYRQQMLQQQRMHQSANQVQRQQQALQAANLANRQTRSGTPNSTGGPSPPTATMAAPNQQPNSATGANLMGSMPRPSSSQGQLPNGLATNSMQSMAGLQASMPAAQMQALLQNQQAVLNAQRMGGQQSPEALRLLMQQRAMLQQPQQGMLPAGMGSHNSNLAAAHLSPAAGMPNPQMVATLAAAQRGQMNGVPGGNQTSPRANHAGLAGAGQLSSGHTPTINTMMQQVHAANPNLSAEQVRLLAQDRLKLYLASVQRSAAAAAAGAGHSPVNNGMPNMNMLGNINMNMNMNMAGMANMGMMNGGAGNPTMTNNMAAQAMAAQRAAAAGAGGMNMSPQQYQARVAMAQQQQRLAASQGMQGAGQGQQQPLSRSATPAQGNAMMHSRSGSGAGLDMTGSPLLQ